MQRFNDASLLCLSFAINGCWLAAGFFKTLFQLPRLYSVELDKKSEQVNDMPKKSIQTLAWKDGKIVKEHRAISEITYRMQANGCNEV
jgi:hypothetical protein